MIHLFASSLAILGFALLYGRLFRRSLAQTISASAFTVSMALYMMSIFGMPLRLACALVMAAGWGSLLWSSVLSFKKRQTLLKMDLAAVLLYALCALFTFTFLFDKRAIGWDEFSHWMLTLKNMFHFDSLGLGELSSTEYQSYPPAVQLFESFHLIFYPDFKESNAFMGRTMLLLGTLFAPAFHNVKHPISAALRFLILFFAPVAFYSSAYSMLYIDAVLGFLFAHIVWLYFSEERFDRFFVFHFTLSSAVLVLVKNVGIALFALAMLIILIDVVIGRRKYSLPLPQIKKKDCLLGTGFIVLIPVAAMISWNIYQRVHQISDFWQSSASVNLQSMMALITAPKAYQSQVLRDFIYNYQYHFSLGRISTSFALYPAYFFALCAFVGVCAKSIRRGILLGITLCISYWAYIASILAIYLLLLPEVEAVVLSSFKRYMNNQTLSCSLFTLYLLLNPVVLSNDDACASPAIRIRKLNLRFRKFLPFLVALSFPFLSGSAASLVKQYLGARQDAQYVKTYRAEHTHLIEMANSIENKEAQIYYLYQSGNNGHYQMARLHAAPIRFNRKDFCIAATPEHTFDTYTAIKSPAEWSSELAAAYDYVYLDLADEAFADDYEVLFESREAIASHAMYKVVRPESEGELVLLQLIDRE